MDAVRERLGKVADGALAREQALPADLVTRGAGDPVAVLTRVFMLGRTTTRAHLDAALPRTGTGGAVTAGLVEVAGAGPDDPVHARVDLRPYAALDAAGDHAWWVASDLGEVATGGPLPTDHVLGVGHASTTLAQLTVRSPVERVLDVGTGCGVQALHASRHAAAVTATDTSRRALAFAAFTTALAGVDVDLREGSLLDPVAGERFDLVVSNPPFVITPRSGAVPHWSYRDGGLAGDAVVARLVAGVGDHLAPGGVAQLLGDWELRDDEDWSDLVGGWLEGTGLDAVVVQREQVDAGEYAETWLRDGGQRDGAARDEMYAAWLADFSARGVRGVGLGYLVLRRPESERPPSVRLLDRRSPVHQPLGDHLAAVLAAVDRLAGLDDAALLDTRWHVAGDVTEVRHHRPGEAEPAAITLEQGGRFGLRVAASTAVAAAVGAMDGDLSVGQLCGALAVLLDAGEAEVRGEVLPAVRELAADALLLPTP